MDGISAVRLTVDLEVRGTVWNTEPPGSIGGCHMRWCSSERRKKLEVEGSQTQTEIELVWELLPSRNKAGTAVICGAVRHRKECSGTKEAGVGHACS